MLWLVWTLMAMAAGAAIFTLGWAYWCEPDEPGERPIKTVGMPRGDR